MLGLMTNIINMTTEMFAIPTRTASSSAYCICCIILVLGLTKNSHTHTQLITSTNLYFIAKSASPFTPHTNTHHHHILTSIVTARNGDHPNITHKDRDTTHMCTQHGTQTIEHSFKPKQVCKTFQLPKMANITHKDRDTTHTCTQHGTQTIEHSFKPKQVCKTFLLPKWRGVGELVVGIH